MIRKIPIIQWPRQTRPGIEAIYIDLDRHQRFDLAGVVFEIEKPPAAGYAKFQHTNTVLIEFMRETGSVIKYVSVMGALDCANFQAKGIAAKVCAPDQFDDGRPYGRGL